MGWWFNDGQEVNLIITRTENITKPYQKNRLFTQRMLGRHAKGIIRRGKTKRTIEALVRECNEHNGKRRCRRKKVIRKNETR